MSQYAALLLVSLGAVGASRIHKAQTHVHAGTSENSTSEGAVLCNLTETDTSLGYGIHGVFPVKSCMLNCKFHPFMATTFKEKILVEPDQEDRKCKCNYAPRYWEGAGSKKFWFQFRVNSLHQCTIEDCREVFFTWGNMFLKKWHYPGDNERMPVSKHLESQENYDLKCAQGIPEGIVLPSPGSKITELRLLIAKTTDRGEGQVASALGRAPWEQGSRDL